MDIQWTHRIRVIMQTDRHNSKFCHILVGHVPLYYEPAKRELVSTSLDACVATSTTY